MSVSSVCECLGGSWAAGLLLGPQGRPWDSELLTPSSGLTALRHPRLCVILGGGPASPTHLCSRACQTEVRNQAPLCSC